MAELTDQDIDAALKRGFRLQATEPRAAAIRYDRRRHRFIVDLTNGATFGFPIRLVEGLGGAADDQLADVEILGDGYGLHWEQLDVDFTVPGLLGGIFGTASYMARRAGRATSTSKAAAARANGAKGGRPRKVALIR